MHIVVSDCAGGKLDSVADNVVLICQNIQRILCFQRFQTALWHGKGIVGKSKLFCFRVEFIHGEIIHIAETESVLLCQPQLISQFISDFSRIEICPFFLICNKENRISCLQSGKL